MSTNEEELRVIVETSDDKRFKVKSIGPGQVSYFGEGLPLSLKLKKQALPIQRKLNV